ncbi:MAG: hypothetical protein ABFC24_04325 [Methanoregulaceae archaeon]
MRTMEIVNNSSVISAGILSAGLIALLFLIFIHVLLDVIFQDLAGVFRKGPRHILDLLSPE